MDIFPQRLFELVSADVTLQGLLGTDPMRFYPELLPQDATLPAVVYQLVSAVPEATLQGQTSQLTNYRVQLTTVSYDVQMTRTVALELERLLAVPASTQYFSAVVEDRRGGYEDATQEFFNQTDLSVWYQHE